MPQVLFNYFKQLFAQVTNPPIDGIREETVTSAMTLLGDEGNILNPTAKNANRIRLKTPILSRKEFAALTLQTKFAKPTVTLPILFKAEERDGLEACLEELFEAADKKSRTGQNC